MELTQEYLNNLFKNLTTKEDLQGLATKEDLQGLATKEEVAELRYELTSLRSDVSHILADLAETKETVDRIDKRDLDDSNAFAKDIVQLQKDVKGLKLRPAA